MWQPKVLKEIHRVFGRRWKSKRSKRSKSNQIHYCVLLVNYFVFIVASKASDLLFKTIFSHVTPYGPQVFTLGFSELSAGGGGGGGAGNSSETAMYFEKPIMQDGS